ncbi:MAG TPA: hypothetical protein ENK92_02465 [Bacteroidetes bacterium]|nr:hypothetical protein [Bacteroidota bacterium]
MQSSSRKIVNIAILAAIASIISILERFIPMPVPFIKPGLSNIFVIMALFINPWGAVFVVITKILFTTVFFGGLFQPVTLMQLLGGLAGVLSMHIIIRINIKVSMIGLSITGAFFHNVILLYAAMLFANINGIGGLFSLFSLISLISGAIVGISIIYIMKALQKRGVNLSIYEI